MKLARPRIAISLYRAITEKHAFYSCETVGSDVTKQFIRDFKVCIAWRRNTCAFAVWCTNTPWHILHAKQTLVDCVIYNIAFTFEFSQGTIASMFNVHTKLGRLYVFDIQRTYREVYDHARRVLHAKGIDVTGALKAADENEPIDILPTELNGATSPTSSNEALHKMEKEVAERISEAITCRICMDREIDTSFTPCGHITSCNSCAEK